MELDATSPFIIGKWRVDPSSAQIESAGKRIKLEPRVMELLIYLSQRPGQVVTRSELEAAVWNDRVVSYDALSQSIQKLRRAFADNSRHPVIIETIAKKGYRIVAQVTQEDERSIPPASGKQLHVQSQLMRNFMITLAGILLLVAIYMLLQHYSMETNSNRHDLAEQRLSIAVLPFNNLSGKPEQDYFADGMTDDLITELARNPALFVIARDSTFLYKNRNMDMHAIAQQLNVRYILHGSSRKENSLVHLNVQLIDTRSENLIWAERYRSSYDDIFKIQSTIVSNIINVLDVAGIKQITATGKKTDKTSAYDYFLHGRNWFFQFANKEDNNKARNLYQKAIELDNNFATAYAMLAWTHAFDAMNGWTNQREDSLARAHMLAHKAIELDGTLPVAYFVSGLVYREKGEYVKALVEVEKAIKHDPSYANAHVLMATLLYYAGRPKEGLEKIQLAMRLNPHHPYNYPFHMGQAYFVLEQYSEAINSLERGLEANPSSERMHVWLAASYARAGRIDDAHWQAEQVLLLNPDFSLQRISTAFPFKDTVDQQRFLDSLKQAGLK